MYTDVEKMHGNRLDILYALIQLFETHPESIKDEARGITLPLPALPTILKEFCNDGRDDNVLVRKAMSRIMKIVKDHKTITPSELLAATDFYGDFKDAQQSIIVRGG